MSPSQSKILYIMSLWCPPLSSVSGPPYHPSQTVGDPLTAQNGQKHTPKQLFFCWGSKWIVCLPPIAKSSEDTTHSENKERKMGWFRVHFCQFLGCEKAPQQSVMGCIVDLDTKEGSWHHRDNAHKILLWEEGMFPFIAGKWGFSAF